MEPLASSAMWVWAIGGGRLDAQAQLDEDLARQGHPGQRIAHRDDLHLDLQRLAVAFLDVEYLVCLDLLHELGLVLLLDGRLGLLHIRHYGWLG